MYFCALVGMPFYCALVGMPLPPFPALVGMPFPAVVGVLALATPTTHYVEQCIWVFLSPQPPYLGGWGVGFL